MEKNVKCPNCDFDNLDSEKYCLRCLHPLKKPSKNGGPRPKLFIFIILGLLIIALVTFLYLAGLIKPTNPSISSIGQSSELRSELSKIKWDTYSDTEYNFSIKYPSSWYYFGLNKPYDEQSYGSFVLFSSTLGNTSIQESSEDELVRLVVNILPKKENDVESWLKNSPLLQFETDRIKIDGYDAVRLHIDPNESNDGKEYIYLFLVTKKNQYSLVGSISSGDQMDSWSKVINKMQNSFKSLE